MKNSELGAKIQTSILLQLDHKTQKSQSCSVTFFKNFVESIYLGLLYNNHTSITNKTTVQTPSAHFANLFQKKGRGCTYDAEIKLDAKLRLEDKQYQYIDPWTTLVKKIKKKKQQQLTNLSFYFWLLPEKVKCVD